MLKNAAHWRIVEAGKAHIKAHRLSSRSRAGREYPCRHLDTGCRQIRLPPHKRRYAANKGLAVEPTELFNTHRVMALQAHPKVAGIDGSTLRAHNFPFASLPITFGEGPKRRERGKNLRYALVVFNSVLTMNRSNYKSIFLQREKIH